MARPRTNPIWKIPEETFVKLISLCSSKEELLIKCKVSSRTGTTYKNLSKRAQALGLNKELKALEAKAKAKSMAHLHKQEIPIEEVLIENSTYARQHLKRRLLKEGLLTDVCAECGLAEVWNGKPIVLHLDHINGTNNDNRLENLRLLCPNCHSQTKTYCGRNKSTK